MKTPRKDGILTKREMVAWFDHRLPTDLPDAVIDRMVEDFWGRETEHLGITDGLNVTMLHQDGGRSRISTADRKVWVASTRTVARYRGIQGQILSEAQEDSLRSWQLDGHDFAMDSLKQKYTLAKEKAEALLKTIVDENNFAMYQSEGRVMENSKIHHGICYVFNNDRRAGNVQIFDIYDQTVEAIQTGNFLPRAVICTAPVQVYPTADLIVAQVLHLRANEETFLQLANLHDGSWSEEELEVRARRQFYTVPRYDPVMGGYVDVPFDLNTLTAPYDASKNVHVTEVRADQKEDHTTTLLCWASAVPDTVVSDHRIWLREHYRKYLTPDPETMRQLKSIDVEEPIDKIPEPPNVDTMTDSQIRLHYIKRARRTWINDYEMALGLIPDDPTLEELLESPPASVDMRWVEYVVQGETQGDFTLVDEA